MNDDVLAGKWKQAKGHVREWWGKLTDDDIDRINGKSEQLVGLLQERYGWTKERARQEMDTRLRTLDTEVKNAETKAGMR
jgi:uncharacterized protein YjbJ (UPF0337 family)